MSEIVVVDDEKDMHTQKIVGNSFSKTIYTTIVLDALDNALTMKKL